MRVACDRVIEDLEYNCANLISAQSHMIDIRSVPLKMRSQANSGVESFQKRTWTANSLFQSRMIDYMLISLLLTFHLITTHLWLSCNTQQIAWDQIRHFFNAVEAFQIVNTGLNPWSLVTFSEYYPPFFYLVTIPFISLGPSLQSATMVNILFLGIILFCTYGIARHLFTNRGAALLAVFLVGMYPGIFTIARVYMLDLALTAMVALSTYLILKTNLFSSTRFSLLLGIALGFGMLTKWTFPLFLFIPTVYSLAISDLRSKKTLRNLLLISFACGTICLPWYLTHLGDVKAAFAFAGSATTEVRGDVPPSAVKGLSYLVLLINSQIFIVFFAIFLLGLALLLSLGRRTKLLLLLAYAFPYVVLSIPSNIDLRFTLPLLPFVAVISSVILRNLSTKKSKALILIPLILFSFLQFSIVSYEVPELWSSGPTVDTLIGQIRLLPPGLTSTGRPVNQDWRIPEILNIVYVNSRYDDGFRRTEVNLDVLVDHAYFDATLFKYYSYVMKLPIRILGIGAAWNPENAVKELIYQADYVVTKSPANASTEGLQKNMNILFASFKGVQDQFQPISRIELPDDSLASIYKRTHYFDDSFSIFERELETSTHLNDPQMSEKVLEVVMDKFLPRCNECQDKPRLPTFFF